MKELVYKKSFENKRELTNVFIPTNKDWESTETNGLSVIESGKKGVLFHKIIENIKKAKRMICLQSFLIQDTEIINALLEVKQKGVRVFIMDSAEARLNTSGFEEDESFATQDYKKMLEEKVRNNFVHRQANNLHAKFILIDPKTNPKGFLFTGNFNEKPFFENPELAIELSKIQIKELFEIFVYHFWEYTTDEQTITNQFEKVKPINKFKKPILKSVLILSPDEDLSNLNNELITTINQAKKRIVFSIFGLDINHQVSQSILTKLKEGVDLTVYCRPREKTILKNIELFKQYGATVFCHPLIHAKCLLVDDVQGYIFSSNFETHKNGDAFETGVKLGHQQVLDLKNVLSSWNQTFPLVYQDKIPLKDVTHFLELKDAKKLKLITAELEQKEEKVIIRADDLVTFFSSFEPKYNNNTKRTVIHKTARIDKIKSTYKMISTSLIIGVDIIEYKKDKKPLTEKALLIDSLIVDVGDLITKIKERYNNFKLFVK